jgi:hypothetical protein
LSHQSFENTLPCAGTQLLVWDTRYGGLYRIVRIREDGWMEQEDGKRYSRLHNPYKFFVVL